MGVSPVGCILTLAARLFVQGSALVSDGRSAVFFWSFYGFLRFLMVGLLLFHGFATFLMVELAVVLSLWSSEIWDQDS